MHLKGNLLEGVLETQQCMHYNDYCGIEHGLTLDYLISQIVHFYNLIDFGIRFVLLLFSYNDGISNKLVELQ